MANKLQRRSGVAVVLVAELIDWKPDLVVQVGIGHFWKEVAVMQEVWPDVRFIGFEPHLDILKELRGKYPGLVYETALGEDAGRQKLWYNSRFKEGASLFPGKGADRCMEVTVRRMDQFVDDIEETRILYWIDCEGSELSVLKGSTEFLKGVDVVNIELTGNPPRPGWPSPVEVNRWLLDHGFVSQYIHTHRSSSGQNDMVYVKPHLFRPEFCSCPLQVEDFHRRYGSVVAKGNK